MSPNNDQTLLDRLAESPDDPNLREDVEEALLKNPAPAFHRALDLLFYQSRPKQPVQLEFSSDQKAALTTRRAGSRRRDGYVIRINSGFYNLLSDVTEISVGWSEVLSKTGDLLMGPSFTVDKLLEILKEAIAQYVSEKNQWVPRNELKQSNRQRLLEEYRLTSRHRRSAIHYGRRQFMILFAIGHELGHILKRHCDPPGMFSRHRSTRQEELEADRVAARQLIEYLKIPPLWRVNPVPPTHDGTELFLYSLKLQEMHNRYFNWYGPHDQYPASPYHIGLVNALIAIAMLFIIYDLTERAALELQIDKKHDYPPASERYASFRETCVNDLEVSEESFTEFVYGVSAPDEVFRMFGKLTKDVSWASENGLTTG